MAEMEVKSSEALQVGKKRSKVVFQAESPADKIRRSLINVCERDGGRYIHFDELFGILVGAVRIKDDYFFAIIDKDRKVQYVESTERYSLVKDIPGDLSVLNYLWMNDRISLLHIATTALNEVDEILTPVYIRIPHRQSDTKRQMGRKNYRNNTKQKPRGSAVRR